MGWSIFLGLYRLVEADLHLLGSMELIKCQNVGVGLDLFFTFSNGNSSDICHSIFPVLLTSPLL